MIAFLFLLSTVLATFVQPKSANHTLVLVDSWATLETHSLFFEHIRKMGAGNHTLEFQLIDGNPNDDVSIERFEKYLYDNIILMAPSVRSFGKHLKVPDLLEFVDTGHNVMLLASADSRRVIRDVANEFGLDYEDYGYVMKGGPTPDGNFADMD